MRRPHRRERRKERSQAREGVGRVRAIADAIDPPIHSGTGDRLSWDTYGIVREHLESFLAHAREQHDDGLPKYVEEEFRAYLRCGIFAHGFVRAHCDACGHDLLVAFSWKTRGICPSCNGRRMSNTAAHLVDRVLPNVPVRQYVLSLPFELRRPSSPCSAVNSPTCAQAATSRHSSDRATPPLLRRCFSVDVLECASCGGRLRVMSVITAEATVSKIRDHLKVPSVPPPVARARAPDDAGEQVELGW